MTIIYPIKRGYIIFCPGCQRGHGIWTQKREDQPDGPVWQFNGNLGSPTFTPSVKITGVAPMTDEDIAKEARGEPYNPKPYVCHFFITDGKIAYCDDTTHQFRGQTLPLEQF